MMIRSVAQPVIRDVGLDRGIPFRTGGGVNQATPTITIKYGLLYNWYAASDERNITNIGCHIPTMTELGALQTYLGGRSIAGGKIKETGYTYWDEPNTGATNEVGFNARGSGIRLDSGDFGVINIICEIRSSTWCAESYESEQIIYSGVNMISSGYLIPIWGLSIRLLKDSTTLTHGQTGTYTGNDGKVYRTICIGTQEWLADNLAETKYRNGDTIPEVTDNAAWAALTTGALCAYDNDWNNAFTKQ